MTPLIVEVGIGFVAARADSIVCFNILGSLVYHESECEALRELDVIFGFIDLILVNNRIYLWCFVIIINIINRLVIYEWF
jgi:hypothetical protein